MKLLLWALSWDTECPHYEVAPVVGRQPWGAAASLSAVGDCTRAEWQLLLIGNQSCILLGVAISLSCCSQEQKLGVQGGSCASFSHLTCGLVSSVATQSKNK